MIVVADSGSAGAFHRSLPSKRALLAAHSSLIVAVVAALAYLLTILVAVAVVLVILVVRPGPRARDPGRHTGTTVTTATAYPAY